jgi:catechol 2,3-dioxygenase-like lactoylglutathione lyase family enzyme
MSYFIRVLGRTNPDIHPDHLKDALARQGLEARLAVDDDDAPEKWKVINVENTEGQALLQIERNAVEAGRLGLAELTEFRDLIHEHQPQTAMEWLQCFFDEVSVIYAFEVLNMAAADSNFEIVSAIRTAIWDRTGGILQNDNEGFTNEDGFHILWQFDDDATGDKYCAVLDDNGSWLKFRMDLGDPFQRMAFLGGEVPQTAVRL